MEIGRAFGGKDHSTVINALRRITSQLLKDSDLKRDIELKDVKIESLQTVIKKRGAGAGPAGIAAAENASTTLLIKKLERQKETVEQEKKALNEELEDIKAKYFNLENKMEKTLLQQSNEDMKKHKVAIKAIEQQLKEALDAKSELE